jgi:uncharacterized protein (DUF58 family)
LIGWAAVAGGDRIGGLLASGNGHVELRPTAGRRALMKLLHALESRSTAPGEDARVPLRDTLARSVEVARPGSLVFIIGDYYDFDGKARKSAMRLAQHNDVVMCQVLDRVELNAPPPGRYPVSDGRSNGELRVGGATRTAGYDGLGERLCGPVRQFARAHRLIYGLVTSERPIPAQLEMILG